jgi:hypothetical protein
MHKNQIAEDQNSSRSLKLQRAKEQIRQSANYLQIGQAIIPIVNAVFWIIILQPYPSLKVWSVLLGFLIPLLDATLLDSLIKRWKLISAKVQEIFETEVLHLEWNTINSGEKPAEELITENAVKFHNRGMIDEHLPNWYTFEFNDLPYHAARVICQRSNCWWDAQLRNTYSIILLIIISAIGVGILIFGIAAKVTLDDLVLTVVAPFAPLFLWGAKEAISQRNAAILGNRLLNQANSIWDEACSDIHDNINIETKSRLLQDQIFTRRKDSPINPRWLYFFKRQRYQLNMIDGANELIKNYRTKRGQSNG